MIGIIICGHARFADGVKSAQELLIGQQKYLDVVEFDGVLVEKFESDMEAAIKNLAKCKHIIIVCDLIEGTPFQISSKFLKTNDNLRLIGGANLSLVTELSLQRYLEDDLDKLISDALIKAKDSLAEFKL